MFSDKNPPIDNVKTFLDQYGNKPGQRKISTDNGGELEKSARFRDMLKQSGYGLENMVPASSFQNGQVERTHCTLGNMMCSLLTGAKLGHKY